MIGIRGIRELGINQGSAVRFPEYYQDILEAVYYEVDGTEFLDSYGGTSLTLSASESESYLPYDYAGTITAPDEQALKDCDDDDLWYAGGTPNNLTVTQLIAEDFDRTLVHYDDDEPYHIRAIAIIKAGVVLTDAQKDRLSRDFRLWVFYFGTWRDSGAIKENRTFGDPYSEEYQAVIDAMTTPPSGSVAAAQNTMVKTIVNAGLWNPDLFYLLAQESNGDGEALINWANPGTYDLEAVNSPTFTSLEGFTGNASNSYLKTGFIPSTHGVNFTPGNCTWIIYLRAGVQNTAYRYVFSSRRCSLFTGSTGNSSLIAQIMSNNIAQQAESLGAGIYAGVDENSPSASHVSLYKNNAVVYNGGSTPQSVDDYPINLLARSADGSGNPQSYVSAQVSFFAAFPRLTQEEIEIICNAVEAYMDSNGKGIIT